MAQMDPAATKSASSASGFDDYAPRFSAAVNTGAHAQGNTPEPAQPSALYPDAVVALVRALELAADRTATTIALGTKQTRLEVRTRLGEVVNWLIVSLRNKTPDA
ncbi:MAG TPA: hypothetical protein VF858_03665, partial [Gemmatimonadaceae bacterium]